MKRYLKLKELKEAFRAFFNKPFTTRFPYEPHTAFPKFRGKPTPDENRCIACGACAQVCPARAIEVKETLDDATKQREIIWHYDVCIFCGQCERLCTTEKGVTLTVEYDLATLDRTTLFSKVTKELVTCESCGEVIAPKAQLLWLLKRLGPLSSGNFNLVYTAQKELRLTQALLSARVSPAVQRPDLYSVLCPKCRHQAIVFNQTGKQP